MLLKDLMSSSKEKGRIERRKYMRFDVELDTEYRTMANTEITGIAVSRNISKNGLCIRSDRELEKDLTLDLKLNLPGDNTPIFMQGRVVWCQRNLDDENANFNTGISFTKVDGFDRGRLLDYVYSRWLKNIVKTTYASLSQIQRYPISGILKLCL